MCRPAVFPLRICNKTETTADFCPGGNSLILNDFTVDNLPPVTMGWPRWISEADLWARQGRGGRRTCLLSGWMMPLLFWIGSFSPLKTGSASIRREKKKSFNTIQTSAERSSIEDLSARRVGTSEALNSLLAGSTITRTNSRAHARIHWTKTKGPFNHTLKAATYYSSDCLLVVYIVAPRERVYITSGTVIKQKKNN